MRALCEREARGLRELDEAVGCLPYVSVTRPDTCVTEGRGPSSNSRCINVLEPAAGVPAGSVVPVSQGGTNACYGSSSVAYSRCRRGQSRPGGEARAVDAGRGGLLQVALGPKHHSIT
jgi:hypothetical protein